MTLLQPEHLEIFLTVSADLYHIQEFQSTVLSMAEQQRLGSQHWSVQNAAANTDRVEKRKFIYRVQFIKHAHSSCPLHRIELTAIIFNALVKRYL